MIHKLEDTYKHVLDAAIGLLRNRRSLEWNLKHIMRNDPNQKSHIGKIERNIRKIEKAIKVLEDEKTQWERTK